MAIIAKNNTAVKIPIDDLGVSIPASGQRDLTEVFKKEVIAESKDLPSYVLSGDITINDGVSDLNISDGLKQLTIQTEWEDQDIEDSKKVKISESDSTAAFLIDKLEAESNNITLSKIILGGYETLKIGIDPNFIANILKTSQDSDDTISTTTLTTWQDKLSHTVLACDCLVRIGYTMEFNANANNKEVEVRLYNVTDGIEVANGTQSTNANTNYFSFAGFHHRLFTGAAKTYILQYRGISGACTVRNVEIESWRVG